MKMYTFNGTDLTEETILKTRQWFYDNAMRCIEDVKNGNVEVNDKDFYIGWKHTEAELYIKGECDHILTFLQRAYYIQTGKFVALLS